jgi:hypothetical protein
MRSAAALLVALWLGLAAAQLDGAAAVPPDAATTPAPLDAAGARLPLASAGTVLRWAPHVEELSFDLPDASWVRLAVYSPSIDLDEIGDERYDDRPLEAAFSLLAPGGAALAEERFALAPSGWHVLFDGPARAGRHLLRSEVLGHGKNVYLLRLETEFADVALHGAQVTVNVSSRDWQPALSFTIDRFARCELGMYDGDGDDELEAVLVLPSGDRVQPTVSGDLAWSAQPLPRLKGVYTVELRIPPQAYQATNAVRFELRCAGEAVPLPLVPPATLVAPAMGAIEVEVVDLQGRPLDIGYRVEGRFDRLVTLDEDDGYRLVDIVVRGGAIDGERSVAFGPAGGFVRFVLDPVARRVPRPAARADLAPLPPLPRPTPAVAVEGPLPLPLPRPLPAVVLLPPPAPIAPAPAAPTPPPALLELERDIAPDALLPCQIADVRLTVRNVGGSVAPYDLQELLPAGVDLVGADFAVDRALRWSGALEGGGVVAHAYRLRMGPGDAEALTIAARLAWDGDEIGAVDVLRRVLVDIELTLVPADRTLYADDAFVIEAFVRNPLDRPVRVWLAPTASSRVVLLEGPTQLDLPAGGVARARYAFTGREAGAAAFQLVPYACDPTAGDAAAAGPAATLRLTLAPLPELPLPVMSTVITVDLAARRLPVLDGLVLVSRLPEGARYLAGSGRVDGEVVADPREVDGALVFELDGRAQGRVDFTVLHDEAIVASDDDHTLIARTPRLEVLIGDPDALELLLRGPQQVAPPPPARERVGAVIQEPVDGAVLRAGSSTRVTVDADLGHEVRLFVNDGLVPAERVGQLTRDAGMERQTLQYIGVPLQAGPNALRLESEHEGVVVHDAVTVFLAGAPAAIAIEPLSPLLTGTVAPLGFEIRVADAWGVPPRDSFVTVDVAGGVIASRDADPQRAGHQVAFRDGHGVLELAPFAEPGRFTIVAAVGLAEAEAAFEVAAEARPWIVNGIASLGVHLGDGLRFGASGRGFARGAVFGDALLTLAVQAPLEPIGTQGDPHDSFPVPGSSGGQGADAQSRHGVYARLERGQDFVQYGDFVADFAGGLQSTRAYTGLSGAWTGESSLGVRAYAAYVPVRDLVTGLELPSDGTSAYRLPDAPLRPGTLRLEVVKRDRLDGRLIVDDGDPLLRVLTFSADYTVDEVVGVVLLARPLPLADGAGHPYLLRAGYQVANLDDAPAFAQVGVQASYDVGDVTLRAGVSQETRGAGAFERLASAGVAVDAGPLTADLDVGYGSDAARGGLGVALGVRYAGGGLHAEVDYRFLGVGYRGGGVADDAQAGHAAKLGVAFALTPDWTVGAGAQLRSYVGSGDLDLDARLLAAYQGRGDVRLGERLLGTRPRAEVGVQGDAGGVRALGSVALRDVLGIVGTEARVTHLQGLGVGVASTTDVGLAVRVSDALELRLTDRLVWGESHTLLVGLQSSFEHAGFARRGCEAGVGACTSGSTLALGRSTVTAQYEIPGGVSATAGSLRVGLDTRYPLSDQLRLEGSAAREVDLGDPAGSATVLTAGLVFDGDAFDASARYEVRFTKDGTKQVATAGATGALGAATFGSVQLRYLVDPAATAPQGLSFSVAGAYRGDRASLLTHHRGSFGNLQAEGASEFEGDTRLSWRLSRSWEVRAGHAYQLLPGDAFVDLWSLGATAYPWGGGSVSAYGRLFHDWSAGDLSPGIGLEVAQALGCGLYGVAGVNAWEGGGADRGAVFGQPGVFLRLDVVFDENWRCGVRAAPEER